MPEGARRCPSCGKRVAAFRQNKENSENKEAQKQPFHWLLGLLALGCALPSLMWIFGARYLAIFFFMLPICGAPGYYENIRDRYAALAIILAGLLVFFLVGGFSEYIEFIRELS
jgi:hypothetical protein